MSGASDAAGRRARLTSRAPVERLRERLAQVEEDGWFFAAIADAVAERRLGRGLSQQQLADLCGTTQSAIARLEAGGDLPESTRCSESPGRSTAS